jgi:ABC-type multidrug transport system fused ATPase/permease subunit
MIMAEAKFGAMATVRRFWPTLRPQRKRVALAVIASLMASGLAVLAPMPVKIIIDDVLQGKALAIPFRIPVISSTHLVIALAAAAALLAALAALFSAWEKMISARAREKMALDLRMACLDRLLLLTPLCRGDDRSGELSLRLIDDVQQVARLFTKTAPVILRHALTLVMTLIALAWINPVLGAGALAIALTLSLFVKLAAAPLTVTARAKRKQEGRIAGAAQEIIRQLSFIQSTGADDEIRRGFETTNRDGLRAGVEETRAAVRLERIMQIANGLAVALIVGGGGVLALRGAVSAGDLAISVIYFNQMLRPVEKINELASAVVSATSRAQRLAELLDRDERLDRSGTHITLRARGQITLNAPHFAYANGREFAFDAINIPARSLVLIKGPSGAGKSTLLALLTRLFDPATGSIALDGIAFQNWDLTSLRAQFSVAPQAPPLLSGTVRSWLRLGNANTNEAALWNALKAVALAEMILARGGLDAPLGEGGMGFSGGEQARLSLARALMGDRPVLLLDEPFANVDQASADVMLSALRREKGCKTIIIVSHQPLPEGLADLLLLMNEGRLSIADQSPRRASA